MTQQPQLELKKPKVRLHDQTPNTITLAFVIDAHTRKRSELLGDADGRHGHYGKTERSIFSMRNYYKSAFISWHSYRFMMMRN